MQGPGVRLLSLAAAFPVTCSSAIAFPPAMVMRMK